MSDSHTDTADEQQEGRGRHRGHAAPSEESADAARGRHRRPASQSGTNG